MRSGPEPDQQRDNMPAYLQIAAYPLWGLIAVFAAAAITICIAGTRLSGIADELADRTGLGEVIAGALFVGATTSLPGAITSVSTAWQGAPDLAVGNAMGSLTAQTAFIAVADLFYRRANLEHSAASVTSLAQDRAPVALDMQRGRRNRYRNSKNGGF